MGDHHAEPRVARRLSLGTSGPASRLNAVSELLPAGRERLELTDGWELARTAPGQCEALTGLEALGWQPANVPGTAAGALGPGQSAADYDAEDWWFRVAFPAEAAAEDEEVVLLLGGLATVAEVYLNGRCVLESESMFAAHELDVGDQLRGSNELAICCRALAPRLALRRQPRARWRTKLVSNANLRFYRTMLLGRAPGFAPGPAVVGPWRAVALERRRGLVLSSARLRARVREGTGVLQCTAALRGLPGTRLPARLTVALAGATGGHEGELTVHGRPDGAAVAGGTVEVSRPDLWWPHTHGAPALYGVAIGDPGAPLHHARMGFRRLQPAADLIADGLDLRINGVPVFARGAVWTPLDLQAPEAGEARLRAVLQRVVQGGMNMLRVPGVGAYESDVFYDLCDELGILVWQDFMFANLDYPEQDIEFMDMVRREARALLSGLGGRPSLAVLCGGSEVAQQVAMLGLDPALAEGPLYGELLPGLVRDADVEAPYIPSAPWGGDLPFRTDRGVANYYGVGAYRRPLEDARRSDVRFAAECLAFANVPDEPALRPLEGRGGLAVHDPAWKAGVPRDAGAGWDFDDVRDHYLGLMFGVDPVALRSIDPDRYLELSRSVSGEVMAEVLGEWRRAGSPCHGALVLWLKDLAPGAGWGVLDHRGEPKVAYHHLRRALAPVAVWSTDEGLGGVVAHIANDGPEPLPVRLRVALYRNFEQLVDEATEELELAPRACVSRNIEAVLGRFVDAAWAYRFGPPAQDLIAISLERDRDGTAELLSQAFRFPAGRPLTPVSIADLGLSASVGTGDDGRTRLQLACSRFTYGVRVSVPGYVAGDDAFGVEPGRGRTIPLTPTAPSSSIGAGGLTALNLSGRLRIDVPEPA
jgi:beta-mannosidase